MNTKDMISLKYKYLQDGFIIFEKAKTEMTNRPDNMPISVYVTKEIQEIINRWGNKDNHPEKLYLPHINEGLSPMREYELKQHLTHCMS